MEIGLKSIFLGFLLVTCAYGHESNTYFDIVTNAKQIIKSIGSNNSSLFIEQYPILHDLISKIDIRKILVGIEDVDLEDIEPVLPNNCSGNACNGITGEQIQLQKSQIPSLKCLNDSMSILPALLTEDWARRMIDATAKPPSGLLNYNLVWLGNYDECLTTKPDGFNAQYCLTTLSIMAIKNPLTQAPGILKIGLCMPDSCSSNDIVMLMNSVIVNITNNQLIVTNVACQEPDRPYDTKAIISLSVISVFCGIMAIATAYDVFIKHVLQKKTYITSEYANEDGKHIQAGSDQNDGNVNKNGDLNIEFDDKKVSDLKSDETKTEAYKPGVLGRLLLSFSIYTNAPKILSTKQGAGALTAINGIRFISMTWVILGHTFAFGLTFGIVGNAGEIYPKFIKRQSFMAIMNAEVSVDTFFALRLTPPYMLVIMVYIPLFPYLGSGPFWAKDGFENNNCEDSWWYNILYINNFRTSTEECFAWAWYLANDMQFYVVSPLIFVPLFFSKLAGTIVTTLFLIGTTVSAAAISKHFDLDISSFGRNGGDYFDNYYQKPYCRMGPYIIGMYTGYILYKTKCKCKLDKYVVVLLWTVFAFFACLVLYGAYDDLNGKPLSTDVAVMYNAFHKTVWGAAVCWVIFACATGNGGFINTFLSWRVFTPLARLTYCAYLIHPIIQYYFYASRKEVLYWDTHEVVVEFLGHIGLSYAAAFIASLAFESPMMALEKVIFKRRGKK